MLRTYGLLAIHHLQRLEDFRLANERWGFSGLLYRRTCFTQLSILSSREFPN